jgi:hypothetical protein
VRAGRHPLQAAACGEVDGNRIARAAGQIEIT